MSEVPSRPDHVVASKFIDATVAGDVGLEIFGRSLFSL